MTVGSDNNNIELSIKKKQGRDEVRDLDHNENRGLAESSSSEDEEETTVVTPPKASKSSNLGQSVDGDDTDDDDDNDVSDAAEGRGFFPPRGRSQSDRAAISLDYSQSLDFEAAFGFQYNLYLSGRKWLDRLCNLWHIAVLFLSLCLFMFGILLRFFFGRFLILYVQGLPTFSTYISFIKKADDSTEIRFTGYIQDLGTVLILLNTIYVACTLGYMTYPVHKFSFSLPMLCVVCAFATMTEMAIINISFAPAITQNETVIERLHNRLKDEYQIQSGEEFSIAYDYISIWLGCCGITSQYDFKETKLAFTKGISTDRNLQVPPTCCHRDLFLKKGSRGRQKIIDCAVARKNIYKNGCFTTLTLWLQKVCRMYTAVVIAHLLDCFIHAYLYKNRVSVLEKSLRAKFGVSPDDKDI